jgi:putative transposase
MRYRRAVLAGGDFFFTLNLANRQSDLLVRHVDSLRDVMRRVKAAHPFTIMAVVVLPDHLHALWRLPPDDAGYPLRWSLIKAGFSGLIPKEERLSASRVAKRERGIWQRRYWEHRIRDERDFARHVDYIHYNPVKHGWVRSPREWPHSSVHRYIARGELPRNWGMAPKEALPVGER